MPNVLPSQDKTVFLFCEDARLEIGNKITLVGAYLGGDIVFQGKPNTHQQIGLPQLTFLFIFHGGQGVFKVNAKVVGTDGKVLRDGPLDDLTILPGVPAVAMFKVVPFLVGKDGSVLAEVSLDGTSFRRDIPIKFV